MAQNPQQQAQQAQRVMQQITQLTQSVEQLIGQTDPRYVRSKNKLEKSIFLFNRAGHLIQKFSTNVSKQKVQKQEANGQEEQQYQSQPSQSRRWQPETAMQQ